MSSNLKIKRICAWCGKEFIAQKTTTACCSKQCANALYKKRKRDEAIKANNQVVEKKIEEKPIVNDFSYVTSTYSTSTFTDRELSTVFDSDCVN